MTRQQREDAHFTDPEWQALPADPAPAAGGLRFSKTYANADDAIRGLVSKHTKAELIELVVALSDAEAEAAQAERERVRAALEAIEAALPSEHFGGVYAILDAGRRGDAVSDAERKAVGYLIRLASDLYAATSGNKPIWDNRRHMREVIAQYVEAEMALFGVEGHLAEIYSMKLLYLDCERLTPERLTTILTDLRWWEQDEWTTPDLAKAILAALEAQP